MVIKSCANDSRNFESVRATLVEYHTGVHLSEGRTSGSGKGPRQGSSGKAYSRGKGKHFVSKAYIADHEALAYPDEATTTTTTTRTPTRRPRALLSGLGNEDGYGYDAYSYAAAEREEDEGGSYYRATKISSSRKMKLLRSTPWRNSTQTPCSCSWRMSHRATRLNHTPIWSAT